MLTGREHDEINRYALPAQELARTSLSGYERNKLFLSEKGTAFHDLSGVSGLDSIKDSRSFAIWDYDRDGWQDVALTNINAPVLGLYRNNLAAVNNAQSAGMLAVRCVGGNNSAAPNADYSPRDGIGAKIFVKLADRTLLRELHCGEGLAAQNSSTLIFGIGSATRAESITIHWPSGKEQSIKDVPENTLLTVYENPEHGGEGGFEVETYRRNVDASALTLKTDEKEKFDLRDDLSAPTELIMYTSMATWCTSCREHLPDLEHLRRQFDPDQLAMYGVPVDLEDTSDKLKDYVNQAKPAYALLANLDNDARQRYHDFVMKSVNSDALPTTVITNARGEVLHVATGIPSVSEIRRIFRGLSH